MAAKVNKIPIPEPITKYLLDRGLYSRILKLSDFTENTKKSVYTEKEAKMNVLTSSSLNPIVMREK